MLALLLALTTAQTPPELTFGWEQGIDPTIAVYPDPLEVVGGGSIAVIATRSVDGAAVRLAGLAPDGTSLWSRSVPLDDGARFADLELAEDGSGVLLLLARDGGGAWGQRLLTFDAATGVDGWAREFPPVVNAADHFGALDAAAGVTAVVRSAVVDPPVGGDDWEGRLQVLASADGADISVSAPFFGDEGFVVELAPDGAAALVWSVGGAMRLFEASDGSVRWDVEVPTSPTALPLGSGVTAAAFDGSGSVVARADGVRTVAFAAADASFLWAHDVVDARDVVPYGADRFFVCGVEGFGSASGAQLGYAMLDASTGSELWAGQVFDPAQASSALFLKRNHAAVDEVRGRVAFRDKQLFVVDAAGGTPIGANTFDGSSGLDSSLAVLANGTWLGSNSGLQFVDGVIAQAFDTDASALWSQVEVESEQTGAVLLSIAARDAGQTVRTAWQVNPLAANPDYEVRSAATGEVLHSWKLPFSIFSEATWATSPDGARVASIEQKSSSVVIRVQDAQTGAIAWEVVVDDDIALGARDLAWSPDSEGFATIGRPQDFSVDPYFVLRSFDADAPTGWIRVVKPGPGQGVGIDDPRIHWEPDGGALLVTHRTELGVNPNPALRVERVGANSGASLGSFVWDDGTSPSVVDGHTVLSVQMDPALGRAYVALSSESGSEEAVRVLAIDLAPMVLVGAKLVVPFSITVNYSARGVAASPDRRTLTLVGRGPLPPPGGGLSPVRLDVLDLPSLDVRYTLEWQNDSPIPFGEVEYVNEHVIAVRHGGIPFSFNPSATLELFDVASGQSLAAVDDADGLLLTGALAGGFAQVDGGVVLFGRPDVSQQDAVVQRVDVASLLSGPETVASVGGPVEFAVDAGPDRAGDVYLLVGSVTGTSPGTPVGDVVVPLVGDLYSRFTLAFGGEGVWADTLGVLDGDGAAAGTLFVPPFPAEFAGTPFFHAAIVFTAEGSVEFVTQPVEFTFVE